MVLSFLELLRGGLFLISHYFSVGKELYSVYNSNAIQTKLLSLILIIGMMIFINKFFIFKPKYHRYFLRILTGFFIGQGIHWIYYAAITTLHSSSNLPVFGYLIISLGIVRILITLFMIILMIFVYHRVKDKLNMRLYLAVISLSYCLSPIVLLILLLLYPFMHPWIYVLIYNLQLIFLFIKKR